MNHAPVAVVRNTNIVVGGTKMQQDDYKNMLSQFREKWVLIKESL